MWLQQAGAMPRPAVAFGLRIQINNKDSEKLGQLLQTGSLPASSGSMVTSSSGTATVGSGLTTGGAGLMLSGPDAAAAQVTLNAMQQLGSEKGVQYSQQNPMLGGFIQFITGWSMISGGGGGASSSSRSPN